MIQVCNLFILRQCTAQYLSQFQTEKNFSNVMLMLKYVSLEKPTEDQPFVGLGYFPSTQ